ncbi:hypothetical protein TrRE_jg3070, partial [Triparma retinervis]
DYSIKKCDKPEAIDDDEVGGDREVGTRLTLHLKDDCLEFSEDFRLKELLEKYSEFIEYPISVFASKTDYKQVPDEEANKDLKEGELEKMKSVPVTTEEYSRVNNQKPIWLRSPREFDDLIPRYLKFIRGVVDSDDLPLNVGREILQKSRMLSVINKRLIRKSLDMIKSVEEKGEEEYMKFWRNFGKYIKVGVVEDENNGQELAGLCRFQSTTTGEKGWTSLVDYVSRMKEGQEKVYYVSGEGLDQASMSPCLEGMRKLGYEVLYMTEPLDEIAMQTLGKFGDFAVADATKEQFPEGDDEKAARALAEESLGAALSYMGEILGDKVSSVGVAGGLTESPAALVQGEYGMSPSMQRYMQAQAVAMGEDESAVAGMMGGMNKARLEVNPTHGIVKKFDEMVRGGDKGRAEDFGKMIYDLASITSGYKIEDSRGFAERIIKTMEMVDAGEGAGKKDGEDDVEVEVM